MAFSDLAQVAAWLGAPHVARWWASGTTVDAEVDKYRRRVAGEDTATVMFMATEDGKTIGWCQWYRWDRYQEAAEAMGALPGEVGVDYAIGEPGATGRGLGTQMVAALVIEVRRHYPGAGVLVDPRPPTRPLGACSRRTASGSLRSALSKESRPISQWRSTACPAASSALPAGSSLARCLSSMPPTWWGAGPMGGGRTALGRPGAWSNSSAPARSPGASTRQWW